MKELETIGFRELEHYKNNNAYVIIDLRSKELFQRRHIDGAWNIPYEFLEDARPMLPKEKTLLLYCERGGTAMLAGKELMEKGYHVKAAVGGFEH